MEIRGAGNFLGAEQSGHLEAIGYDLYCQMLREAMADLRGEERPAERLPLRLDMEVDAYFPEELIADPTRESRSTNDSRISRRSTVLRSSREELRDRYGRLPSAAVQLLKLKELRWLLAEAAGVAEIRVRGAEAALRFHEGRTPAPQVVQEMVRSVAADLSFAADGREGLRVAVKASAEGPLLESVEALLRVTGASDTLTVSHVSN